MFQIDPYDDNTMTKDDKEACGFELTCTYLVSNTTAGTIRSSFEDCGSWREYKYAPVDHFLIGFRLKVQPDQGALDDVGASNFRFRYRIDGGAVNSLKSGGGSGTWSSWSQNCNEGSAICAIQTREQDCCNADETSINDVRFECCSF